MQSRTALVIAATFHLPLAILMEALLARIVAACPVQNNICPDKITWLGPGVLKVIRIDGKLWRRSLTFEKSCVTSFKEGYMILDGKRILDRPGKAIGIETAIAVHSTSEYPGHEIVPAKVVTTLRSESKFKKGKRKGGK